MNPLAKRLLWSLPIPFIAGFAISDWSNGKLDGYWCFVVCFLAICFIVDESERGLAEWEKELESGRPR